MAKHMDAMHPVPFRVTSPTTTEAIHIEGAEKYISEVKSSKNTLNSMNII